MSYCRFSSEGFRCDVYAYESTQGSVTVHVARSKHRWWYSLIHIARDWAFRRLVDQMGSAALAPKGWTLAYLALSKMAALPFKWRVPSWVTHCNLKATPTTDCYGLTHAAAANFLERLRAQGYRVPQYAIDELRADAVAAAEAEKGSAA